MQGSKVARQQDCTTANLMRDGIAELEVAAGALHRGHLMQLQRPQPLAAPALRIQRQRPALPASIAWNAEIGIRRTDRGQGSNAEHR
eukprot:3941284-Rhodomonas_salina.2